MSVVAAALLLLEVDNKTISSNDDESVGIRTRSVLNSGSGGSDSVEQLSSKGEEEYCSGGDSDLVVRQLQPAETEEQVLLFLVLCLGDCFLGGSGDLLLIFGLRSLLK